MSAFRKLIKRVVPRRWRRAVRRVLREPLYVGDYPNWEVARKESSGYDDASILLKTVVAARAVRDGHALWDRDTVVFHEPQANVPVLRALRAAAAENGNRLHLVDFGGSLGSTWRQHRSYLADVPDIRWSVIEQAEVVAAGRQEFTMPPLRFYESLAECLTHERPSVVLLSCVLPYLGKPHALLAEIAAAGFRRVIIDRTGFVERGRDRLTVQHVPKVIYSASYPCWFFDRAKLLATLGNEWRVVDEWATVDDVDIDAECRGLALARRAS